MGAASSREPRSVVIDNPTGSRVIDISDDVVKRLKQGITQQASEQSSENVSSSKAATSPPPSPPKHQPTIKPQSPKTPPPTVAKATPTIVYSSSTPYNANIGHTLTAADVRREMEIELEKNDELWRQRITQLEETLKKSDALLEKEYANALEDVRNRFITNVEIRHTPPCQDLKAQLLACYRAYPGQTLKCTEEVTQFHECVDSSRRKKLTEELESTAKAVKGASSSASQATAVKAA